MLLLLAWVAGFLVAAVPTGPLTLLFYEQVLTCRWARAATVAGVVTVADGVYSLLAVLGHGTAIESHPRTVAALRVLGVLVITWLGARLVLDPPAVGESEPEDGDVRPALISALAVAAFNPSALLTWVVVVDLLRTLVHRPPSPLELSGMPVAFAVGAGSWFFGALAAWRAWLRPKPSVARRALRLAGVALIGTAALYAWRTAEVWSAR